MAKNYYEILEISINATPEIIKAAYRTLAKRYHVDNGAVSDEKMEEVNEAYETLNDPSKKIKYDAELRKNSAQSMKSMHEGGTGISVELFEKQISFSNAEMNALKFNYKFSKNSLEPIIKKFESSMNLGITEYMNTSFSVAIDKEPLTNMNDFPEIIREVIADGAIKTLSEFKIYSYPIDQIKYGYDWSEMNDLYEILLNAAKNDLRVIYKREKIELPSSGFNAKKANDDTVSYESTGSIGWDLVGLVLSEALSGEDGTEQKNAVESDIEREIREKKERFRKNFVDGVFHIINQVAYVIKGEVIAYINESGIDIDRNMETYYLRDEYIRNIFNTNKDVIPRELLVDAFINNPFDKRVDKYILEKYTADCGFVAKFLRQNNVTEVFDGIEASITSNAKKILGDDYNDAGLCASDNIKKALEYAKNCCGQIGLTEEDLKQYTFMNSMLIMKEKSDIYEKALNANKLSDDELNEMILMLRNYQSNNDYTPEHDEKFVNACLSLLNQEDVERKFKDIDFDNITKDKALELIEAINQQRGQVPTKTIISMKEKIVLPILTKEIAALDSTTLNGKIEFLKNAVIDEVYKKLFDSCIDSLIGVGRSIADEINSYIENINDLTLDEMESLQKQAVEFYDVYNGLMTENAQKIKTGKSFKEEAEYNRFLGINQKMSIEQIETYHKFKDTFKKDNEGKLTIIENAIAQKKVAVCMEELAEGMENPFCASSIKKFKKRVESSLYDQDTKSKVWTMARDRFFESNTVIINEIINKIAMQYPVIRSAESGFVIYGDVNNDLNYKKALKEVASLNTIEQPIISNLKGSLLGLAEHEAGFSITQGTLLYYEKGIVNRIFLKDITAFNVQKKLLSTDLFVTTNNGMNIKLNAKIQKEMLNSISFILLDIVNAIKGSPLYSEACATDEDVIEQRKFKICPQCGNSVKGQAKFCSKCGHKF